MARGELRLEPVAGTAGLRAFIGVTRAVYAGDPCWVQPLTFERLDHLNQAKNPFLRAIEVRYWIAWRGDASRSAGSARRSTAAISSATTTPPAISASSTPSTTPRSSRC